MDGGRKGPIRKRLAMCIASLHTERGKEEPVVDHMDHYTRPVMSSGIELEKLDIGHVRNPRQWMPEPAYSVLKAHRNPSAENPPRTYELSTT